MPEGLVGLDRGLARSLGDARRGCAVAGDRGGLLQRVKDRQALADQAGDDLVDALGAVQDGEVGGGEATGGCLDEGREDLDDAVGGNEFLVAFPQRGGPGLVRLGFGLGDGPLAEGLRLRGEPGLVAVGFGQGALPVGLRVRRAADLRLEALGRQFGLPLRKCGLVLDDLLRRLRFGERAWRRPRVGFLGSRPGIPPACGASACLEA